MPLFRLIFSLPVVFFYLQRRTSENNGRQCVYLRPVHNEKNYAIADKSHLAIFALRVQATV